MFSKWNVFMFFANGKVTFGLIVAFGLLAGFSLLSNAQEGSQYKISLPITYHEYVPCPDKNPSKGVAWAYGRQNELDEERLCISAYMDWSLQADGAGYDGLTRLNTFWSDVYTSPQGDSNNYFDDLENKLGNDYDGILLFLNEPDMVDQANKTPFEGAEMYLQLKAQCPDCQLYGPMVSAHDHLCKDSPNQPAYYDDLQEKYDDWCWFREWWHQVETLSGEPPQMAGYTIHHILGREEAPLAPVNSLQATVMGLGDLRPFDVIVSEYGLLKGGNESNCDPAYMAEMTEAYSNDPRIRYFFAYTPNLVDDSGWCTLFAPFGSAHFTPTGLAFAKSGNP